MDFGKKKKNTMWIRNANRHLNSLGKCEVLVAVRVILVQNVNAEVTRRIQLKCATMFSALWH